MALKEFDRNPINVTNNLFTITYQIEAPNSHDVNLTEDAETEDEVVTNGKDLYKRFENLVSKD